VAPVGARKFLGYRLLTDGTLGVAPQSAARLKQRVRQITRRNRGVPLARVIAELNAYLSGWVTYFRHARCQTQLRRLEAWIRRKLRCFRLKQCKRPRAQADFLRSLGVPEWRAWRLALSGKGCWRKAQSCQAKEAMTSAWFHAQGLSPPGRPSPCGTNFRKPPWYVERMPGGVGGGNREEPAYPIESALSI